MTARAETSSESVTEKDDDDDELFQLKKRRDGEEGLDSIDSSKFFSHEDGKQGTDWFDEEVNASIHSQHKMMNTIVMIEMWSEWEC